MKRRIIFLVIGMVCSAISGLHAIEYRRNGQDYRALAMGNTGIAGANGEMALFYNPAALMNIQDWWLNVHFQLNVNDTAKSIYSLSSQSSTDDGGSGDDASLGGSSLTDILNNYMGKKIYLGSIIGGSLYSNLDKKGITIGGNYMYDGFLDADIRNAALPEISYTIRQDFIRQGGFSIPLGLGTWVLGFNYKRIQRKEIIETYDVQQIAAGDEFKTSLSKYGNEGTGQGYDIGLIYRHPSKYKIQYGFVYKQGINLGDATDIPSEIAIGMATQHTFGMFSWSFAMDIRDLTFKAGSDGDKSYNRRIHLGTELGMIQTAENNHLLYVRAGQNQGQLTTGAEIRLGKKVLVLGYTIYREETGEWAGQSPDKRYIYYLSADLFKLITSIVAFF